MVRANSRSAPRITVTNSFWCRSKTLASDFRRIKLARYSTLFLQPRNTAPVWDFGSAERSLRPTVAGFGLQTTILAEQVSISRWLSLRTRRAWTSGAARDLLKRSWLATQENRGRSFDEHNHKLQNASSVPPFSVLDRSWLPTVQARLGYGLIHLNQRSGNCSKIGNCPNQAISLVDPL
jgi:hypothetical protein